MIDIDYELTNRYFNPTPKSDPTSTNTGGGCWTFIVCLILGFIGFAAITASVESFLQDKDFAVGFIILLMAVGLLAFPFFKVKSLVYLLLKPKSLEKEVEKKIEKKVTLEDIQKEIEKVKQELPSMAAQKLGIELEACSAIEPVILSFVIFTDARILTVKNTHDNFPSTHCLVVLLFSDSQVFCYRYTFSLTHDKSYDSMDEYFYKDIVSFKTDEKRDFLEFSIVTNGGTSFTANVEKIHEEKIQKMRKLLREKKQN